MNTKIKDYNGMKMYSVQVSRTVETTIWSYNEDAARVSGDLWSESDKAEEKFRNGDYVTIVSASPLVRVSDAGARLSLDSDVAGI